MTTTTEIPEDRELTATERSLILWLLKQGSDEAISFLPQLERTRVTSRCYCGCASINFAIDGKIPSNGGGITVLSEYEWSDFDGHVFGVFVFAKYGLLAGIDVWSQDGLASANTLPRIDELRPFGSAAKSVSDMNARSAVSTACTALLVSPNP